MRGGIRSRASASASSGAKRERVSSRAAALGAVRGAAFGAGAPRDAVGGVGLAADLAKGATLGAAVGLDGDMSLGAAAGLAKGAALGIAAGLGAGTAFGAGEACGTGAAFGAGAVEERTLASSRTLARFKSSSLSKYGKSGRSPTTWRSAPMLLAAASRTSPVPSDMACTRIGAATAMSCGDGRVEARQRPRNRIVPALTAGFLCTAALDTGSRISGSALQR